MIISSKTTHPCPHCKGTGATGSGPYDVGPCGICLGKGRLSSAQKRLFNAHTELTEAMGEIIQETRDNENIHELKHELEFYKKRSLDLETVFNRFKMNFDLYEKALITVSQCKTGISGEPFYNWEVADNVLEKVRGKPK